MDDVCLVEVPDRRGVIKKKCRQTAHYIHDGVHYCSKHYPPNVAKVAAQKKANKEKHRGKNNHQLLSV